MKEYNIFTNEERYLTVLEIVEPYVVKVTGPCDWDPGYLLTCMMPPALWRRIRKKLKH